MPKTAFNFSLEIYRNLCVACIAFLALARLDIKLNTREKLQHCTYRVTTPKAIMSQEMSLTSSNSGSDCNIESLLHEGENDYHESNILLFLRWKQIIVKL